MTRHLSAVPSTSVDQATGPLPPSLEQISEALLSRISSPADLRGLSVPELRQLAAEIRETLVNVVSRNGGHLAPGLGAVELTLALHTVFQSPRDKIVWDVGHQTYPHKLVTGRRDVFSTLRTYGGIAGFPRRVESPHDVFGTAHASTSISAALGLATARDLAGEDYSVVAVIGDGGLTGGLAFEGLNQAGFLKRDLLVVVNDNTMSIAPNVGALSRYLTHVVSGRLYRTIEADVWHTLGHIPRVGHRMRAALRRVKEGAKKALLPAPSLFFEDLGFRYYGPIDGHDVAELLTILRRLQSLRGPVLLHVCTVKGKGYSFAEADACHFHGVAAFDRGTGKAGATKPGPPSWTEVFGKTLTEMATQDSRIVAITAAMPDGTGLTHFQKAHPDRFFDVGIAESHAVTFAAGLAVGGRRPVAAIYSTFLQRAYDQVVHDVAVQKLPVVFAVDRAGLVGEDGATHHGVFDLAYLRCVPNIVIACPRDENELRHLLYTAIRHESGPFVLRYPRGAAVGVPLDAELREIPIGTWEVVETCAKGGIALLGTGVTVELAQSAARLLRERGHAAGVVDARFVKPLDVPLLRTLVADSALVVTLEDHMLAAGFGSAVLETVEQLNLRGAPVHRLGLPDRFIEHGSRGVLLKEVGLTADAVADMVLRLLSAPVGV
jgi:1-deoxy-D-xylulose-5-phosphate synthase